MFELELKADNTDPPHEVCTWACIHATRLGMRLKVSYHYRQLQVEPNTCPTALLEAFRRAVSVEGSTFIVKTDKKVT